MIPGAKLANADQVASVVESVVGRRRGRRLARRRHSRLGTGSTCALLPDRGLDIGAAWFRGTPLAWISQAGEQGPSRPEDLVGSAWGDAWGGGLVTTCGLSNVGAASEGYGLHGTYTARPAADLQLERSTSEVTATATVVDPPFTLSRRIVTTVGQGLRPDRRPGRQRVRTGPRPRLCSTTSTSGRRSGTTTRISRPTRVEVVPRDDACRRRPRNVGRAAEPGGRRRRAGLRARRCLVGPAHEPSARASS